LPQAKAYSVKNTKPSDADSENTSTLISVDQNGVGHITDADGWFANLPLRLGDKMYDVTEIAADGSQIVMKPSKSPLRGVIVGRTCPPFSFKTADGKAVAARAWRASRSSSTSGASLDTSASKDPSGSEGTGALRRRPSWPWFSSTLIQGTSTNRRRTAAG